MLVPLAQGGASVGDWLAAVEAAGPSTPLADPMFVGTVFIPHNEVRSGAALKSSDQQPMVVFCCWHYPRTLAFAMLRLACSAPLFCAGKYSPWVVRLSAHKHCRNCFCVGL